MGKPPECLGKLLSSRLREGEREGGPKEGDDAKGEEGHVGGGQGGQEKSQLERDKVGISVNFEGHTCGARIPPSLAKREQSPEVQSNYKQGSKVWSHLSPWS